MTKIIKVNPVNPEPALIDEAAEVIKNGGLVAFPTETVYGLGADAFNGDACKKIFEAKKRPSDNPLIVHISKLSQLDDVASDVSDEFLKLAKILWPGPVTFRLKKGKRIPKVVSAGLEYVGVRMPAHPIALRLIDKAGPIAAPSANMATKPSSTRAKHVIDYFDGKIDVIIDGGDAAFGLESTIIDMRTKPSVLLRPGSFTIEELEKYVGKITIPESINKELAPNEVPLAPGMKYRHYSPDKKLIVVKGKELLERIPEIETDKKVIVLCSNELADKMGKKVKTIKLGNEKDLYGIAKNLFDSFIKIDKMNIDIAIIQSFPERGIGLALMNRITKASGLNAVESLEQLNSYLN